jgi:hypothetical protein
MASAVAEPAATQQRRRWRIYAPVGVLAILIAIAGFWPTYFGPMASGTLEAQPIIHLHAAVFTGWLVLVVAQAWLAATRRIALHVRVGSFGMLYGAGLVLVGVATAFVLFAQRIEAGEVEVAQNKLFAPLTDLMVFTPFLAAAWVYRRKPEVHKRLIVVATTILLIAAVHRLTLLGERPAPPVRILLVWLAPIYLAMTYDWIKSRRVHPVYLLGVAAVIYLKFFRVPLFKSELWRDSAAWFTTWFT